MKKTLSMLLGVALAATAFGQSLPQLTMTVSTDGPDHYADGTTLVLPGETYLLVYVNKDKTFDGVLADKRLVNTNDNRIALKCPADAAGGRCGELAIMYDVAQYDPEGSWALVLLDTRNSKGVGGLVVSQSLVTQGVNMRTVENTKSSGMNVSGSGLTSSAPSKVAADTPTPVIASLTPEGTEATIRIKDISAGASYNVESTTDLASNSWTVPKGGERVQALTHAAAGGSELEATVKTDGSAKFFRVVIPGDKANR
jgi:hypothetical protein